MKCGKYSLDQIETILGLIGGRKAADALLAGEAVCRLEPVGPAEDNPLALPVPELIDRLCRANEEEKWGLPGRTISRLVRTAPSGLPAGRDTFLSFRVRWGEGRAGVMATFERHAARVRSVFGESGFIRWQGLLTDGLSLVAGNVAHEPAVEWVVVDLSANRKRRSISSLCRRDTVADEGIAIAWLYPERVRAVSQDADNGYPAWICAGYKARFRPYILGAEVQVNAPAVTRSGHDGVWLSGFLADNRHPSLSVPVVRTCSR